MPRLILSSRIARGRCSSDSKEKWAVCHGLLMCITTVCHVLLTCITKSMTFFPKAYLCNTAPLTRQFGFSKGSGMSAAGSSAWAASSMIRASNRWGMTLVLCVAVVGVAPEALWGRAASAWANSPPATFSVHTYIGQMHSCTSCAWMLMCSC
eukprot:scaffold319337_cov30-Tisochrysis_lutea.AAC.1